MPNAPGSAIDDILSREIDPAFAARAGFILHSVEKLKPKRVLDVGCGRGFYVNALASLPYIKNIYGVDINPEYIRDIRNDFKDDKRVSIQQGSIYDLPFRDGYFGAVICSEILEHLDDDAKALKEIRRVLANNGTLLVSVPNRKFPFLWDPLNWILMKVFNTHVNKNIWWLAGIWADHERLYTKEEVTSVVRRAGFNVSTVENYIRYCVPFSHFLLYAIGKNIVTRMKAGSFDRFNRKPGKGYAARFLSSVMRFPSKFDGENPEVSMNIALSAAKSSRG